MGTWIGHLRIAEQLLKALPHLDAAAFAAGSLAPDSGVLNAERTAFEPPKEVTHFLPRGAAEGAIHDGTFYRQYLAGIHLQDEPARYSFLLAYFFHLVADNLWALRVGERFRSDYARHFATRGEDFWWELKKDWYDLDFKYLRDHPQSLFWRVFLPTANPPAYFPDIPEVVLHQQLDRIRSFYSHPGERLLDRAYPYLSEATMSRYVNDSVRALLEIHRRLEQAPLSESQSTSLALLPSEMLGIYAAPLGDP